MPGPLSSLRILDFSTLLPGPCATLLMADMGAEVLRVESPTRLDLLRVMPPMLGKVSASHAYLNRGKRSLALDLKKPGAVAVVERLLASHDILVEQFRPGVMERLGLGYSRLREINPRLIYCSITGYGQTGPLAHKAGHDLNYLALSGVSACTGRREQGPLPLGVQVADVAGGSHHAVMGILAAVIERSQTGLGQHIDISMTEAALTLNHMSLAGYLAGAPAPDYETDLLNGGTCYDYYATSDGRYLSMGALEPQFVQTLCQAIGQPALASRMLSQRPEDIAHCKATLGDVFRQRTLAEWQTLLGDLEVCVEPVLTFDEVRQHPQFTARQMFCEVALDAERHVTQVAPAIKFSGHAFVPPPAGGAVGRETRQALQEAGFTDAEIADLAGQGLFGKGVQDSGGGTPRH